MIRIETLRFSLIFAAPLQLSGVRSASALFLALFAWAALAEVVIVSPSIFWTLCSVAVPTEVLLPEYVEDEMDCAVDATDLCLGSDMVADEQRHNVY